MESRKLTIEELINQLTIKLHEHRYSKFSISKLTTVWNRLKKDMAKNEIIYYSAKVGINFLESEYGITFYKNLSCKDKDCARPINMLSEYFVHGIIFPRTKSSIRKYHTQFQSVFQGFIDYKRKSGYAEDTLKSYEIYLSRFSDFLDLRNVSKIENINEETIISFANTFSRYSPSVTHCTLYCITYMRLKVLQQT